MHEGLYVRSGFFDKNTNQLKIGRAERKNESYLIEGMRKDGIPDGFGREIRLNSYYIGEFKDGNHHG